MSGAWRVLVLAHAAALAACGGSTPDPGPGEDRDRTAVGTIRQTGAIPTPDTRLETAAGAIVLVGPLAAELARVAGAEVLVRGSVASGADPPTIRVSEYEIRDVDGLRPIVGMLEVRNGALVLRTEDGEERAITGTSERMLRAAGSRVWVTTRGDGSGVVRWGILRPAGP